MWMHREFTIIVYVCGAPPIVCIFVRGCTELSFYSCILLVLHLFYVLCVNRFANENMQFISKQTQILVTLSLLFSCLNVFPSVELPFLLARGVVE